MSGEAAVSLVEQKIRNKNNVVELFKDGFGYGNKNGISLKNRQDISPELIDIVFEFLTSDEEAFVKASEGDGCGDGRLALLQFLERNPRAKMFGSGVMMMAALSIAQGNISASALSQVNTAIDDLEQAMQNSNFKYGAHDAENCSEGDCGCGAIDRFIEIIKSIFEYNVDIKETMKIFLGEEFDEDVFNKVLHRFVDLKENSDYGAGYSGLIVGTTLKDKQADVRTLGGNHEEIAVVINDVEGTTLNQKKFYEITGEKGQAFSVDLWRIRQYAKKFSVDEAKKQEALYGMLIYTLGTSATLTDGSQIVYGRFNQDDLTQVA